MKKYAFIIAALLITGIGGWFTWSKVVMAKTVETDKPQATESQPRPVAIEEIGLQDEGSFLKYPGVIDANQEALLAFRVSGPLTKVTVQLGDVVSKGQILAQIDPRDFRDKIKVLEAELIGARGTLENSKQEFKRSSNLLKEKVIAQAEYDRAKRNVITSEASVKNIRAQLDIAKHQLEDTKLKAPFNGVISVRKLENHEMVSAGQVVMGLLDLSDLEVKANIPEKTLTDGKLKEGLKVKVTFPSLPNIEIEASLKEWSSQPDKATKTYSVTFSFPSPDEVNLLPGMTAEILWSKHGKSDEEITIPLSAVFSDLDGASKVWIYDSSRGTVSAREINTGEIVGSNRLIVKKGLKTGETVVVAGVNFITEGMKVTPMIR